MKTPALSLWTALLLVAVTPSAISDDLDYLVDQLRNQEISVQTLAALIDLDKPELKMGYALCSAAGTPFCKADGSLGYGLCEIADAPFCKEDGSLGYGLCTLSGAKNCRANGSVAYGLCVLAGEKNCKP